MENLDIINNFRSLKIQDKFVSGLKKDKITIPTSIQVAAIPPILENKDFIGEAVTGSGKTLAYLLPAFERMDVDSKVLHTLILVPTHELVVQISNVIRTFSKNANFPVRVVTIMGSVNIKRQIDQLKTNPHIIVGTPGRVLELIKMKKLKAHTVKTIVIDEADKLLSDTNIQVVKDVVKTTLRDRQLLAFSASISKDTIKAATEMMKEPEIVQLSGKKINNDIEHLYIFSTRRDKITVLRQLIHATKPKRAIVFINKNELIQEVDSRLNYHKIKSASIFGNATKAQRKKALDDFKSGKVNVLVSSDLVARGLDLPNMTHIFNMDIPKDLNEYVHRVGRTGRAGKKGTAISIITEKELQFIKSIEKLNKLTMGKAKLEKGFLHHVKID